MDRRNTTKKVLISPRLKMREYHLLHPYAEQGAIYDALLKQKIREQLKEAEAQAELKEAEAKKKSFEEAAKAKEKPKKTKFKAEEVSNTSIEPSASVQSNKKQDTTDWGKWFKDQLDDAAKKFAWTTETSFAKPVNVEDPADFNYILDPYASQRYNAKQKKTVDAAIDREIRRQYGAEIDAYDEQLKRAELYDAITNAQIDERNNQRALQEQNRPGSAIYEPHVDTASAVRNSWESSDVFQKIQATRDYMTLNYTPNEALANKVLGYGTSEYNPAYVKSQDYSAKLDVYNAAKKEYNDALKARSRVIDHNGVVLNLKEYNRLSDIVDEKSKKLVAVEKDLASSFNNKNKYENNLASFTNSIRTQGLPRTKQALTEYSKYAINQLGLMDVLYNSDGTLNEEFVDIGYASDKDINAAARLAADYFKSTQFASGLNTSDDYINRMREDIALKKDVYSHLVLDESKNKDLSDRLFSKSEYEDEYRNLNRAQRVLDKAQRHKELNDIVKRSDGFWTKQTATNIGYGVTEKLKDPGLWTMNISNLHDAIIDSNLADKIKSGQKLTTSEKALANSLAIESVMHQNFGEYEKTMGYKAGQVATESMKFMAEMMATSGVAGLFEAPGKAAMKAAANKYVRKYGAEGFKNILGRNLAKTPGFLKMVGGDTAYSMFLANTLQFPATVADVINAHTGQLTPGVEDEEITITGYEDSKSWLKSAYEAEARAFTENMSEMIGEYGIGAFLKYPFKYFGKQAIRNSKPLLGAFIKGSSMIDNAQQLINKMLPTRAISSFIKPVGNFIKAGRYSGIIGETAEEYYGNAMQHLLGVSEGTKTIIDENGNEKTVKTSFWEEIDPTTELGKQTFFDIIGGIALSSGFLGAGSALNYARIAHNYDTSKARLINMMGKDIVELMENSLSMAHSANVAATANTIIRGISNAKDKEAFIEFYENLMKFHGANQADQKIRESNDTDVFEKAKREAEINGYSVEYNSQRVDLQRGVDSIRRYTEQQLGVEEGSLDDVIEDNGGVAEFVSMLKSSGNDSLAATVMAYSNSKAQYEASMRRLMDDIDEDLANNEKWTNRLANDGGKIIIGTTKEGNHTVFVKSGTHIEDGEIKADKDVIIVNQDGTVESMDGSQLNDKFEEVSVNKVKRDLDLETYENAARGFDLSNTTQRIGLPILMSNGRTGIIINKTADGRIMYSVNDPSTNTETVRITDHGVTEDQLIKEWQDAYTTQFLNDQMKKAQRQLSTQEDITAKIEATREVREYIRDVKERQRQDLENKHGKAIKYASGILTPNTVKGVMKDLKALKRSKHKLTAAYVALFNRAGVTVDASNWKRLLRLISAYNNGQLSLKELQEILCDGSTHMSTGAKEDLENISVDKYGNVTRWKDLDDTNLETHIDIDESDINEETLNELEEAINKEIQDEYAFLMSRGQRKKRGEVGRKATKRKRAEQKKLRKLKLAELTAQNKAGIPEKINTQVSEHHEAAPAPTPGDITRAIVKQQSFPNQKEGIEKLNKQADWTDANVLREQTTGHNYFIMIDGKRVMFTRVHGVLDDQYRNIHQETQVAVNIEQLNKAYASGGVEALKKEIESLMKKNKVDDQSTQYLTYLDENPDEYEAVIDGVAHVSAQRVTGPSVVFGQYIDEMCRLFFNGDEITLDTVFEDGTALKQHMSQKTLDKFIDQCKQLKSIYDALGWELISNRNVFIYQAYDKQQKRNVNIAGETDMIAVDRQGNYHIIDFKTSYKSFDTFVGSQGELVNLFETIPAPYKGNEARRSTKEQYENLQTMYSMMVESTLDANVQSIEIMPFRLDYDHRSMMFNDIENQARVLNNLKTGLYDIKIPQRIILDKNGELVSRFSDKRNLNDIEARKKLETALNGLQKVELGDAAKRLPESQLSNILQLVDDLNEQIDQINVASNLLYGEDECNALTEQINEVNKRKEDLLDNIEQKVEDNDAAIKESERLRKEAESAKLSHDAWLQWHATAQEKWVADWKANFESDYQKLFNLCRYLDNWAKQHGGNYTVQPELKDQFDQLVSNLLYMMEVDEEVLGTTTGRILGLNYATIDKVKRCIAWVQETVKEINPVEPVVPPTSVDEYTQPEKSWQNTNGLYKDEFNGSAGVSSSVATDDDQLYLRDVTKNADFIDNSEFKLIANNGKIYVLITYGGHTYTPVAFFTGRTDAGKNLYRKIMDALRSAKSNQKVVISGGVKRSFGLFIIKEEGQYKTAHDQGMIALKDGEPGIDVYDIEYSSTQHTVGITYTREILNGSNKITVTEVRVPQSEEAAKRKFERQSLNAGWITDKATGEKRRMAPDSPYALAFGSAIYTYSNVNTRKPKSSGIFVFMHNLGYTDDPKCCVPVTMRHSFISQNDAKFIIDALLGNYNGLVKKKVGQVSANNLLGFNTTATEFVKGFGGNVVIGGQTIDIRISDIVDLLIPVKGCPSYESQSRRQNASEKMPIYMDLDNVNETGEVLIIGNIEGDGIETVLRSFNIRTNDGIQALEDFLQKVERNMNMNGFAQARLGNIGSNTDQYGYPMPLSNNPTGGVTLKLYVKEHGSLRFGNSCISFDAGDFSNPDVQGDTNGISGIGWYLKNGFLECMYNGTEDPLIRVEDDANISVMDESPIEPLKPHITAKEQNVVEQAIKNGVSTTQETDIATLIDQELQNGTTGDYDTLNSMLDDFYGKEQQDKPNVPINKEEAKKNLERILGKHVPISFVPTLIGVSKLGARYAGMCRRDGIVLSEMAESGVEYHEAFHRVMELLFTPEQRRKAYDKFRNAQKGRKSLTDNEIAELFADEFMYYATNQPVVKWHWNITKMFKEIKGWVNMWRNIGDYNLFRMYSKINSGKYANLKPDMASYAEFKQRTNQSGFFGYTVRNKQFEHVLNGIHYKKLLNFIAMSFLHPSVQQINEDGSNLNRIKLEKDLLIKKPLNIDNPVVEDASLDQSINFFTVAMANAPESTRLALQEILDNFDAIKADLAAQISLFATDYKVRYEKDNDRNKEGVDTIGGQFDDQDSTTSEEDVEGSWIDDHTKESYEFPPITRATEKTKFFFSAIPKMKLTDNGWQLDLNELGLPEMYDAQYAFITVLNEVSNCRSIPDLYSKLQVLGEHDGLFHVVAEKFGRRWNGVLSGKANADEQALVVQIFTQLKSTTSEFVLAKSIHRKDGSYDVEIEKTDLSYNARQYVNDWAQSFAVGGCRFFRQTEDGSYQMNGSFTPAVFQLITQLIASIAESVTGDQNWTVDKVNSTKNQLCTCLNMLGITFTEEMLTKYLWSTYNNVGEEGIYNFIRDNKNDISTFCNKIAQLNHNGLLNITDDGIVDAGNRPSLDKLLVNDRFLTTLANAKYAWHRAHDQMSVLIANNAKAYTKSENNLLTDRLDELMYDEEAQRQLMSDAYNYNSDTNTGSILLKNLGAKLRFVTMGGFKTDEYGNAGIDYLQLSKREDYIGKAIALLDGHILIPTMSDKKTWGFIAGLEQKMSEFAYGGVNFGLLFKDSIVMDEEGNIVDFYIPDAVVNQMIEYAECENASIKHTLDSFVQLPENHKVDNFHKGKSMWIKDGKVYKKNPPKDAIEVHPILGARFTSLLGVFENGQFVEFNQLVDENGNYKDEWANYNTAQEMFFDKPKEEQQRLIREVLLNRLRAELKEVENLGLIKQTAVAKNTKEVMFAYENVGLPTSRISRIENQLASAYDKDQLTVPLLNMLHSLAVVSFVADIMNRHIISMQEFERVFSGNPAFFKFGYDSTGHLIDRTSDQSKRLGGLASTGTNNCLDIPGMPKDYTCVEIDNPIVVAEHIEQIRKDTYEGEIRSNYIRYLLELANVSFGDKKAEEISSRIDSMSIEEVEEEMKDLPLLDIAKRIAKSKSLKFEKVDIADGAAYVTDEMCETLLRMIGSWSDEIEEAFLILRGIKVNPKTGKPYTTTDSRATKAYNKIYTTVIGAQKYTAYGYRYQDGIAVPYYNKMALFPLFKNMCTGNMAKLYEAAKDQKIDMIMINSAVKVGSQSKYKITDWDKIDLASNSYTQKYAYLRKQFNTDPKEQELMSMGTQMTKIVMSSMIPGRKYKVNGEMVDATQIRDNIMTAINELSNVGKEKLLDRFFKDGKLDVELFSKILIEELSSRGATKELIDACEVVDGKLALPLDAMSGMNWILSILVSMVNKSTIDINTPGHAFFQRSVWGMEGETNILGDDNLPPSINNGEKLQIKNDKDGSMDCVLSIDFFANILKGTKAEHADFESLRKYLIRKGIIGPNANANMIGYRIPTLAISSIHALRCVDVIPTVRDTIILPEAFTTITGSDFDIDKIFISMKHYRRVVDEERSTDKEIHHKTTDVFDKEQNPEEYYCNMLIDNYLALLRDERAFNQLNGPIDSDTELLTSIVDDLDEGNDANTLMPYQVSTLSFQAGVKDQFVTGKVGIGPFALNNNNHVLTMLYRLKFKKSRYDLLTKLGLTDLSISTDRDGKSIMSWLSGLINAHVDVAKDPYISKLNVNAYTYNLVNLLIRTGLGKSTFYFTTQPIMKMLASAYNTASGVYMIDEGLSKSQAQRNAINDAIVAYVTANTGTRPKSADQAFNDFATNFKANHNLTTDDAIEILFSSENDIMHNISKGGSVQDLETKREDVYKLNDAVELSFYEVQMLVAMANDQLKQPAEKLSDVVKFSKIDTKKQGKNIPEIESYARGVFHTFESNDAHETFENIDSFYRYGYIKTKTDNAIDAFKKILGSYAMSATKQFNDIIYRLLQLNEYEARDSKTLSKVIKALHALIKSKFFFDLEFGYCKINNISIKSLIDGNNSIYNRLLMLKAKIMSQPEYADYRDKGGNPINYLLLVLTSGYVSTTKQGVFDHAKFVQIASITQSDEINPLEITNAWDEMLHDDEHPEIKKFARDLVVYSFLTSVDNGGNRDLFKYVPNSWKNESGYTEYMESILEDFQNGTYDFSNDDIRDIVLNNVEDDFFARTVKADNITVLSSSNGTPSVLAGVRILNEIRLINNKPTFIPRAKFTYDSISSAPAYVKIKYKDDYGNVIQHIYAKTDEGLIEGMRYPIYTHVNSRTTKFKAGNYVYGYGTRNNVSSNVASKDFITKVVAQMKAVLIAVDEDGKLTPAADKNLELAIYNSIMAAKKADQKEVAPEAPQKSVWVKSQTAYSRQSVHDDPQTLYIFTDNTDRTSGGQRYGEGWYKDKYGEGGYGSTNNPTTAQIRGLENAAPISTMRYFYKLHDGMSVNDARWKDSDIEEFKRVIDSEIEDIKKLWDTGKFNQIVSPAGDGFFNSRIALISRDSEIGKYLDRKLKELYNYVNKNKNQINSQSIVLNLKPDTTINIYAGTNENADLSNLAKRPFVLTSILAERIEKLVGFPVFADKYYPDEGEEIKSRNTYNSVEQAFQIAKIGFAFDGTNEAIDNATAEKIEHSIKENTPSEAKRLGRTIPMSKLAISNWDKFSSQIMKELIKASFEQNPQAAQRLFATGNATLTHTQDKGKWGKEFPRLLMEVREELRQLNQAPENRFDDSDQSDETMKRCKE